MTKQEFLKKQRELRQQISLAYDEKNYAKADDLQEKLEALVDPEPDTLLTEDDDLMMILSKDEIGTYYDVELIHKNWMNGTY